MSPGLEMSDETLRPPHPATPAPAVEDGIAAQVGVVIPCYNAEAWVARAIASARAQGDVVAQIVVVEDGSSDGSQEVLRPYAERGEVTLLTGPNKGGCHARNRGQDAVTAPYVAFLDADDLYEGPVLAGAVAAARATEADLVLSEMEIRFLDGRPSVFQGPFGPPQQSERDVFANWFDGNWVNPSAVLWRSAFLHEIGGWDESLRVGQDGEVVLRALLQGARLTCNGDGRGIYHRGIEGSVSITGSVTEAKLAGLVDVITGMCEAARRKGWGDDLGRNYAALYFLARKAFMAGYTDLGRNTLKSLRAVGHRRHHGTRGHVALAGLIGLERKVRWFGS
jgi:glycosyltransferase involved in cell wall biosynthesis